PVNADPDKLFRTGVAMSDFKKILSSLPGKTLFFFDTCHAGNVLGAKSKAVNDVSGVINDLASAESGVVVFSSSTGRQLSYEDAAWGNGAFTKALVEGLGGGANYKKTGRITHTMLDLYISERVKELTRGKQTPVKLTPPGGGVPDFPVAFVR
ncbi:MAG: caspase family protein, partial [Pseudomonadota bacterium]